MRKFIFIFFVLALLPAIACAQSDGSEAGKTFKAKVEAVLGEEQATAPDGTTITQQDLKLKGLSGEFKDKEIVIRDIGTPPATGKNVYRAGDQVLVQYAKAEQGQDVYEATDYVRTGSLLWLFAAFALSLIAVGRWKGVRSLASLALTFLVMVKYIVPQILDGADPVIVTIIGSFTILLLIIYLTEGFNREAHVSIISIFASLVLTVLLSWLFVKLTKLSGLASEEASFIVGLGVGTINLQGILLAGIIIGALGVLDDVAISQVAAVEQIRSANPNQTKREIWSKAMKVGVSHISSMTNTLFLAYAGASLPLLILFVSGQSGFLSWDVAINNEILATEIVRTLAGSIGLIMAVPISTLVAVSWIKRTRQA